jgi:hypothetical protein
VVVSLNLDSLVIMSAGSVEALSDAELPLNKMRFAIIGGSAFVGGAMLLGAASIVRALSGTGRPEPRN